MDKEMENEMETGLECGLRFPKIRGSPFWGSPFSPIHLPISKQTLTQIRFFYGECLSCAGGGAASWRATGSFRVVLGLR